ncbi:glycosyltransferase family 2 protein [bacterium]|nr:glycosyltransferase family 2 protein [candidate division CSSED10-310 bacterium]
MKDLPARTEPFNGKVVVVMPAYNAGNTLSKTVQAIPPGWVDEVIVVDDCSWDNTVDVAKQLKLKVFTHRWNRGYGGNQKTCYNAALESGAEVVVMLHPDYQYDPAIIPEIVQPILRGDVDVVFASRFLGAPLKGNMPLYKFIFNRILTTLQNLVQRTSFTECHTGYRAYSRRILESIPYERNSEGFVFDNEIIGQLLIAHARFMEIPVETRYEKDSSTVSLTSSITYGLGVLWTLIRYWFHVQGIMACRKFSIDSSNESCGKTKKNAGAETH